MGKLAGQLDIVVLRGRRLAKARWYLSLETFREFWRDIAFWQRLKLSAVGRATLCIYASWLCSRQTGNVVRLYHYYPDM